MAAALRRDKRLQFNEEEAKQVREIYATFLELRSLSKTAEALTARGIRTKSWRGADGRMVPSHAFATSTLRRYLRNPLYLGLVKVGDELVEGQHDAILTREQADAAAALLRSNRRHSGAKQRNRNGALLRDLLWCAVCGSAMKHHGTGHHRYYVCWEQIRKNAAACPGSRVNLAVIEGAVIDHVRTIGSDPALVDATIAAARSVRSARTPELIADVRRLQMEATQVERERGNLIEAVAHGGAAVPTLMNRIAEMDVRLAQIATSVEIAEDQLALIQADVIDEAELRRTLEQFDELWDVLFVRERERVLRLLVKRVTYDGRSGEVEIT